MLDDIIGPIGHQVFFDEFFEKKPLLQRAGSRLTDMFSLADFDRYLIAGEGMLQDLVRITHDGNAVFVPSYLGQATTQRAFILEQFTAGATLKLEDLNFRHGKISKLCKKLEEVFGGYVFAKPFLTGVNFSGLEVHFDTTEVFVIQLEGRKEWSVWNKIIENPTHPLQQNLKDVDLGSPVIKAVLEPGDLLYIPAGAPHSAKCLNDYSLHMSIGLEPTKMFEVIEGYLRLMAEQVAELRQNIYPFTNLAESDKNGKLLIERISKTRFRDMLADFEIAYNATKHEVCDSRLATIASSHTINESTKLQVRPSANLKTRRSDDVIAVYYSSTQSPRKSLISTPSNMTLPDYCQEEINALCNMGENSFTPAQLPGKLNTESKVLLCQEMSKVGILILI
ncbi:JmjC domain-containing protein [Xenorhabdus innexi]|uniref:50S ribosomal protein L16 arginine hydroxylase n=1 Tax=Xenorhabdus innexi TaxID=290109 RepID=A0A1N6MWC3_9GAMM|nr:cupin domain-containing protein [Xenorhabdus innexi]PHM36574.1 50S ribosomal protein L16 arginine hydroxylase [Xenorhabdus innexi]SIP73121.1 hypothetical protein XIS1_1750013 [Xenorhabdus innexi]